MSGAQAAAEGDDAAIRRFAAALSDYDLDYQGTPRKMDEFGETILALNGSTKAMKGAIQSVQSQSKTITVSCDGEGEAEAAKALEAFLAEHL